MKFLLIIGFLLWSVVQAQGAFWVSMGSAPVAGEVTYLVNEDFSSCASITTISGTVSCSGGTAGGSDWGTSTGYHTTSTGGNDHWAEATCSATTSSGDSACIILGSNGTDYYKVYFSWGSIYAESSDGNYVQSYNGSYTTGTYTVGAEISTNGSSNAVINLWVDGVKRITDSVDFGNNVTRGSYVGIIAIRGGNNTDVRVDDLTADAGTYTP